MRKGMGKARDSSGKDYIYEKNKFSKNIRLNLNDLIQRRKDEKIIEKKTNLKIFSAAAMVACVVFLVLSL